MVRAFIVFMRTLASSVSRHLAGIRHEVPPDARHAPPSPLGCVRRGDTDHLMPSKPYLERGFRNKSGRRLSSLVELLVGTTRPYGRELRTVIDDALDPRRVIDGEPRGDAECDEVRMISDPDSSLPRGLDSIVSLGRYGDGLGSLVASAKYEAWSLPL